MSTRTATRSVRSATAKCGSIPTSAITGGRIALRQDLLLPVDPWLRRLGVGLGLGLAMGWAATLTVEGDVWWLVALLVEGALAVAASVIFRRAKRTKH